jgi:NADPH:quinone reductase-like Zn-dependent oxidoreductase
MINTEAWVLYEGTSRRPEAGELKREAFSFPDLTEEEVLAEPIYGCWEANMTHALERLPIDVCRQRREEKVVLGNAGVVRILRTGPAVTSVREGDLCGIAPIGQTDAHGHLLTVLGYDAPHSIGLLAKQVKLRENQVVRLPPDTKYSMPQWAAFSLRYATAWSNWKVAYGSYRLQVTQEQCPSPHVWGWGGGVVLAELGLARLAGCRAAMIASRDDRLQLIRERGIDAIDRRQFPDLDYDAARYEADHAYKVRYLRSEKTFLGLVRERTGESGVAIFIDNIGQPVFRATLRALGREGVMTTVGWKHGMDLCLTRAVECINRHLHVHTHGAKYTEGVAAMHFGEQTGWMPPLDGKVYAWDDIPHLAHDYATGRTAYFPIYQVNPL